MLERMGFVWDSHALVWEKRWYELKEFKQKYGHCSVPKNYSANLQLAVWVKVSAALAPLSQPLAYFSIVVLRLLVFVVAVACLTIHFLFVMQLLTLPLKKTIISASVVSTSCTVRERIHTCCEHGSIGLLA